MKKLLLILSLMSTLSGVSSFSKHDILNLINSNEYSQEAVEVAATEAANQLEEQYMRILNEEEPFGKHFCNP